MTNSKSIHRAVASLNLPIKVPALITYAQAIVKGMTGNTSFPTPSPTLAAVSEAITALQNAETAALARTKGAVATRNEAKTALVALLQQLKSYVQSQADATMENGASIIQGAGLAVKKTPVHPPRVFAVKPGAVSGTVSIIAPSAAHRASYEWQYSGNGGQSWITMPVTLQAKTTLSGLTPGSTLAFRCRPVTKAGEGDWSQTVTCVVR